MRGLAEPWGSWQMEQGSFLTGACSKTNGPRLSEWQVKQPGSLPLVRRMFLPRKLAWGLWQLVQDIAPSGSLWRCGFWKEAQTSHVARAQFLLIPEAFVNCYCSTRRPACAYCGTMVHDTLLRAWLLCRRPTCVG